MASLLCSACAYVLRQQVIYLISSLAPPWILFAVLAPAHDPAALLAAARAAGVADLPDFVFVASLADVCCQAGSTDCLRGWAELAARHGVITLDAFAGSSSGGGGGSSSGAGAATFGPSADAAAAAAAATPHPIQLHKMLSMVAEECSFDGSQQEGEQDMLPAVEEGEEGACETEDSIDDAAKAAAQQLLLASGDSTIHAAAATAAGDGVGCSLQSRPQCAAELLAAAAAVGLVPRPGSGCHLAGSGSGSGSGSSLQFLHLDATPLTIRSGECQPAKL